MKSVLCIASSESLGQAGLAVDLRVCAALGVHGVPVLAAVTAQPAGDVAATSAVDAATFVAQLELALALPDLAAIKIGLLPSVELAELTARRLRKLELPIVLDPVSGSSRGHAFLDPADWERAMAALMDCCSLLTPNLPELRALCGEMLEDRDEALAAAARALPLREGAAVLIKGGHRAIDADDLLVVGESTRSFEGERFVGEFRGSGCALSSALAALLARGRSVDSAVEEARVFLRAAMQDAFEVGDQRLPHLFFEYYGSEGLP